MDLQTLGASVAASISARVACFPLDTIAIQHASSTRRPIFSVPLHTYYRGIGASILITTPATTVYYCAYRASKDAFIKRLGDNTYSYILAGITAELASSLLWTPLEVIKARLQISRSSQEGRLLYQLRDISNKEGIRGFYRGYGMGLAIYIPFNSIFWAVYENTKKQLPDGWTYSAKIAFSTAASIATAQGVMYPFDLVKTRYQVATSETVTEMTGITGRLSDRGGVRQIVKNVMLESGRMGFYAGLAPRLACSVPSSIITMSVIEYLKPDRPAEE
ncbi:mitochondrial carrier domain-containing protein [Bisporella sp. PMI_857]|nr:mitochondrial carrier domain-containing protein [Bisporella sp. PMI_857]